jgi:aryl-phospho-beta-D-glucosidase BglC (GH1 family)
MNEPDDMVTELWSDDANAAIQAIRNAGASNLILVSDNGWTGAHSWGQSWYGTKNVQAMLGINDPRNNYAFKVHQYLNSNFSGTSDSSPSKRVCPSLTNCGSNTLARSFGTSICTYPCLSRRVFGVVPLRELPELSPAESYFS